MNERDPGAEQEVRDYVRNRMAGDVPPDFVEDVMSDVYRTNQRRRGAGWRVFAGLATAAAAAVLVIAAIGLINRDDVGTGSPSPSPSASSTTSSSTSATPSPSASPTPGEGEFGPIHSMTPEEAFGTAQTCETGALISNGEPTDITYSMSFPADWYANEAVEGPAPRSACTLFAPVPFEVGSDGTVPESVAITADLPPGGDFVPGSAHTTQEYTVNGVAAIRYDIEPEPGGFVTSRTIVWIIAIAGELPAEGTDVPYMAIMTTSDDPEQLAEWSLVLDTMVATLDIGE